MPVYLYPDGSVVGRVALDVICIIFLAINTLLEFFGEKSIFFEECVLWLTPNPIKGIGASCFTDMIESVKNYKLREYLTSVWNLVDWSHFCVMWLGWAAWLNQITLTYNLPMKPSYPILVSPTPTTQARVFLTNAMEEYDFLIFASSIDQLMQNMSLYNTLTALGGTSTRPSFFHLICTCCLIVFN